MGLLSHICQKENSSQGLLERALKFEKKLNFNVWAKENSFLQCGILEEIFDHYFFTHLIGFPLNTIAQSFSTKDFIEGVFKGESLLEFENENLIQLLQLFSEKSRQTIQKIYVLPFLLNDEKKYFVFCGNFSSEELKSKQNKIQKDLQNILSNEEKTIQKKEEEQFENEKKIPAVLLIFSLKLSFNSLFNNNYNFPENVKQKMKIIAQGIVLNSLAPLFSKPNKIVSGDDCELKAIIFSKDDIETDLLQFHLNKKIQFLFENDSTSNLLILNAGQSINPKGISAFLERG